MSSVNFQFSISVLPYLSVSILWTIKILYCQLITCFFFFRFWGVLWVVANTMYHFYLLHALIYSCWPLFAVQVCLFYGFYNSLSLSISLSIDPNRYVLRCVIYFFLVSTFLLAFMRVNSICEFICNSFAELKCCPN